MAFKVDTSRIKKYLDVNQLYGNSYSYVGLNIDGPDKTINEKIKKIQEKEFEEVAKARLFNQKQHFRYKLMDERNKRINEDRRKTSLVEDARLFDQKQPLRYKLMDERNKRINADWGKTALVEDAYPEETIEEEFKDISIADFISLHYSEEEMIDLIIDIKINDIEEDITKQERCCAWVLTHCK